MEGTIGTSGIHAKISGLPMLVTGHMELMISLQKQLIISEWLVKITMAIPGLT